MQPHGFTRSRATPQSGSEESSYPRQGAAPRNCGACLSEAGGPSARQRIQRRYPGPRSSPLLCRGRAARGVPDGATPWKELLTVGAMSYAGRSNMMVVADRDTCPDLDVFTAGVRAELSALEHELRTSAVA
jgi:hypothetical protein